MHLNKQQSFAAKFDQRAELRSISAQKYIAVEASTREFGVIDMGEAVSKFLRQHGVVVVPDAKLLTAHSDSHASSSSDQFT
jgi:hypothetical protein